MGEKPFIVVDTGGFEPVNAEGVYKEMARQAREAIAEADVIVFVTDGRAGVSPQDKRIAQQLREAHAPVFLAVNKTEGMREEVVTAAAQFFRLPDDPARIAIEIGDGAAFVAAKGPRYDLILVDGYDAKGRVGALDTPAFYAHCRARLRDGGMVATNLLTRHRGVDASVDRMRKAFSGRAIALPPCSSGNVVG